jgi:hypothetical protein
LNFIILHVRYNDYRVCLKTSHVLCGPLSAQIGYGEWDSSFVFLLENRSSVEPCHIFSMYVPKLGKVPAHMSTFTCLA